MKCQLASCFNHATVRLYCAVCKSTGQVVEEYSCGTHQALTKLKCAHAASATAESVPAPLDVPLHPNEVACTPDASKDIAALFSDIQAAKAGLRRRFFFIGEMHRDPADEARRIATAKAFGSDPRVIVLVEKDLFKEDELPMTVLREPSTKAGPGDDSRNIAMVDLVISTCFRRDGSPLKGLAPMPVVIICGNAHQTMVRDHFRSRVSLLGDDALYWTHYRPSVETLGMNTASVAGMYCVGFCFDYSVDEQQLLKALSCGNFVKPFALKLVGAVVRLSVKNWQSTGQFAVYQAGLAEASATIAGLEKTGGKSTVQMSGASLRTVFIDMFEGGCLPAFKSHLASATAVYDGWTNDTLMPVAPQAVVALTDTKAGHWDSKSGKNETVSGGASAAAGASNPATAASTNTFTPIPIATTATTAGNTLNTKL